MVMGSIYHLPSRLINYSTYSYLTLPSLGLLITVNIRKIHCSLKQQMPL